VTFPAWQKLSAHTWTDGRIALVAFFAAVFVYIIDASSPALPASDSVPNACLPASILGDGDLAFSPFEAPFMFLWSAKGVSGEDVRVHVTAWNSIPPGSTKSYAEHYHEGRLNFVGSVYYLVPTVRERAGTGEPQFVSTFGPVPGLTALPFNALAQAAGLSPHGSQGTLWALARLTAACLAAGSVALLYLTAVGFTSRQRALLLTAAYAAGTCVWSISSQSLWQQTPEIFFLALGLFCLLRVSDPRIRGIAAGLALSIAAACRPTAAIVVVAAAIGMTLWDRRALLLFILALIPATAAMAAYNIYYFDSPLDFGQLEAGMRVARVKTGSPELWQTPLWLGAAGLLISPSRGLLVFSPFLVAAFAGAVRVWKDPRYHPLRFLTIAVPALWIPAFLWFDWWGGWTFGYRPIVDSLPLLMLLCLPVLDWILARPVWRATFAVLLAWSAFVQVLGAFAYAPWGWNARVIDSDGRRADIDQRAYRGRLWSLTDNQIGYLIAHFRQARDERAYQVSN
jgi:hypothetical protein